MPQQTVSLNTTPQLLVEGEALVVLASPSGIIKFWIGGNVSVPDALPFKTSVRKREVIALQTGEALWVAGSGASVLRSGELPAGEGGTQVLWILASGAWSDTGEWDDTQQWDEGVTAGEERAILNTFLSDQDLIENRLQLLEA